jgi:outer membrane protein assembly factor BamB
MTGMTARRRWWCAAVGVMLMSAPAGAQRANPVYADLSPVAQDTLARVGQFVAAGNIAEAARECQRLLDEQPDRVVPSPDDADLFQNVRDQVHRALLRWPELLRKYRANEEGRAHDLLASGTLEAARGVETTRLLTGAGLEAALRVAQDHLESARFEAARLTLEQLEEHPDRVSKEDPAPGRRAAALMQEVARYLPDSDRRTDAWARAERWSGQAGLPLPIVHGAAARPPGLDVEQYSLAASAAAVDAEVPPTPLWSVPIDPSFSPPPQPLDPRAPNLARDESRLWVVPTVVGDVLYTNDGTTITARDRFTLQVRWSVQPAADENVEDANGARDENTNTGVGRALEDVNTVTVAGRIVVATTGLARDGSRVGDPRTHALDAGTGRVLWSVHVPGLDPQLDSGSVRGPAMVEADMVILVVRKAALARRVVSVYLVGVSLRTGEPRWVRLIGSAGALPFIQQRRIGDSPVRAQGVVYIQDQLGVLGAVEAATGRPVWIRRIPVVRNAEQGTMPWRWGQPVIDGDGMIVLSPDQKDVLRLDRFTGRVTTTRPAGLLGDPAYILKVGDRLAGVGDSRIAFVPLADLGAGAVELSKQVPAPGIRGRVVPAGDRLLIPRSDGFTLIDPARPRADGEFHGLETAGNTLPTPSQVLVLDGVRVHSYLAWPVAQRLLSERMTANPNDPDPAITYAELAYRAGHPGEIAGAADKALAALDRSAGGGGSARTRLFEAVRAMVESSQERWASPDAPATAAPVLDRRILGDLIDRLGRAAQTSEERITHLVALGRLREGEGKPALAAEAYQRILGDPALSGALWRGPSVRVRAELEAAARVRRLLVAYGRSCYAPFEAEAQFAVSALGTNPTAEALEGTARRYPAASITAGLWLRVADLRERAGQRHAAVAALREGLAAAELSIAVGQRLDPSVPGELAGRLVTRLRDLDQLFAASGLLERLRRELPTVMLTDGGTPIDIKGLSASLSSRLAALQRLPRIGPNLHPDVQTIEGWALLDPVSRERPATEHVMMVSRAKSSVALWGIPGGRGRPTGGEAPRTTERLAMLWTRPFTDVPPTLLRLDPESVYLLWDVREQGAAIERIDAVTGETLWKTEPHATLFAGDAAVQQRASMTPERIDTPLDGSVRPLDVMVAFDEQAMVLADRMGRVASFDPAGGKLLWKALSPAWQVHDIDAGGGLVVVGGAAPPPENPGAQVGLRAILAVYDARGGQLTRQLDDAEEALRWLQVISAGEGPGARTAVVAAFGSRIASLDPLRGTLNWDYRGRGGFESIDRWVFGDRLFVLDQNRALWMLSLVSGRGGDQPLETYDRLTGSFTVQAAAIPSPQGQLVAFLTARGVLVFDPGRPERDTAGPPAKLVGIDALGQPGVGAAMDPTGSGQQLLTPVPTENYFVAVETWPTRLPDGRQAYALHLLDSRDGKLSGPARNLVLWDAPRRLTVLDGRIIVTSGAVRNVTLVYGAPEVDR